MAHYQPVKPWCEIVLSSLMPLAVSGEWQGISMLFPMEKLFEKYVESHLRKVIMPDVKLVSQARAESLCQHNNNKFFELRPDILLEKNKKPIWVIDAKWKSLDRNNTDGKYGLRQSDFYQLYAYGQKYMNGTGNMALIYPAHKNFRSPLPPFDFDSKLRMWVLPFEITGVNKGRVIYHTETDLPFIIKY